MTRVRCVRRIALMGRGMGVFAWPTLETALPSETSYVTMDYPACQLREGGILSGGVESNDLGCAGSHGI